MTVSANALVKSSNHADTIDVLVIAPKLVCQLVLPMQHLSSAKLKGLLGMRYGDWNGAAVVQHTKRIRNPVYLNLYT